MGSIDDKESHVDVLISGAGPSGLMASLYLSELGINHRIIDKRGTRTLTGRADGVQMRTAEIWDSFGLADKITWGSRPGEFSMWTFGEGHDGIKRSQRQAVLDEHEARLKTGLLHQGYIEAGLSDGIRHRHGPPVERGTRPMSLRIDVERPEYPIEMEIRHSTLDELGSPVTGAHTILADGSSRPEIGHIEAYGTDANETIPHICGEPGKTETIRAKYLIGADGAKSWIRSQFPDIQMEGDLTNSTFGVIDIIPKTDFPDIRKICNIFAREGYCLIIPRESGMVRLYVQFPDDWSGEGKSIVPSEGNSSICAEILDAARKILAPYTIDYKYCDWWTVYMIGQGVANHCSHQDRVFLAGDAVHTHSPKRGQGMNVSQQDTYNLAWKIAGVLRKQLDPSILSTYEQERIPVARALIELDKLMARQLTARANRDEKEIRKLYSDTSLFQGTSLCYGASTIQATEDQGARQEAARELTIGKRFPDVRVYGQADGAATWTQTLVTSTGSWRIFVFTGNVSDPARFSQVNGYGTQFATIQARYPPASPRLSAWAEIYLVHRLRTSDIELADFHDAYFPPDDVYGRKYHQIYADFRPSEEWSGSDAKGAHEEFGIDPAQGALVVVRPDQVVSWVSNLNQDGLDAMERWLAAFMVPAEGA